METLNKVNISNVNISIELRKKSDGLQTTAIHLKLSRNKTQNQVEVHSKQLLT